MPAAEDRYLGSGVQGIGAPPFGGLWTGHYIVTPVAGDLAPRPDHARRYCIGRSVEIQITQQYRVRVRVAAASGEI